MAQQTINIGVTPNDGTGDTARDAGDKINDNFAELYSNMFAPANTLFLYDDFFSIAGISSGTRFPDSSPGMWTTLASGTCSILTTTPAEGHPGVISITTGTSTSDEVGILMTEGQTSNPAGRGLFLHATNVLTMDWIVRFPNLPDATNNYIAYFGVNSRHGFANSPNAVHGAIIWDGSAVRWALRTMLSGTPTTTTSAGASPVGGTWYRMTVKATTASASLEVDGMQVATHSVNLPSSSMNMSPNAGITKSAGAANRSVNIDYMQIIQPLSPRIP